MTALEEKVQPQIDIDAEVAAEIKALRESGQLQPVPEPRCWICQSEPTRRVVNNLLARGLTYRDIEGVLDETINPIRLSQGQRAITTRRIKTHSQKHFDLEHPSWGIYRRIVERRAQQAGKDYEQGIGGAVSHLALLETVVHKGWDNLVNPFSVVTVRDAMQAAKDLADIERRSAGQQERSEMRAEMHRIITAVKETVPAEYWDIILHKLGPGEGQPAIEGQVVPAVPQAAEEFDPGDDEDFDDDDVHG